MSELRKDLPSGDWVIIAPGRAARPNQLKGKKQERTPAPKSTCPFEDLERTGNWPPLAVHPNQKHWRIAVVLNKYPALIHGETCAVPFRHGFYEGMTGTGEHEIIITRDHNKSFAALSPHDTNELMQIFQSRHREAKKDPCLIYATTFFNFGPSVGASVWHPHYQFMALPLIPSHAASSLQGAERYFKKNHRCVRCDIVKQEQKEKKRVIAENRFAIAIAPYAGRRPFEVRIMPKMHAPYFEKTPRATIEGMSALLQSVLQRMKKYVGDPDLNFFIHDAPFDKKDYRFHHWHIEVVPNYSHLGGLEFSTGIYINVVDPDAAAAILRGEKIK